MQDVTEVMGAGWLSIIIDPTGAAISASGSQGLKALLAAGGRRRPRNGIGRFRGGARGQSAGRAPHPAKRALRRTALAASAGGS